MHLFLKQRYKVDLFKTSRVLYEVYPKFFSDRNSFIKPDEERSAKQSKMDREYSARFDTLKDLLYKRPILKLPDFDRTFILRTDTSEDGIGAVLLRLENKEKLPVAYVSRNVQGRERSYAVIEKSVLQLYGEYRNFTDIYTVRSFY